MAKKRQTFGKIQRERERAEKRERKAERRQANRAQAAAAAAAGLEWPPPEGMEDEYERIIAAHMAANSPDDDSMPSSNGA